MIGDEMVFLGFVGLVVLGKHQKVAPQPAESSPQGVAHFPLVYR